MLTIKYNGTNYSDYQSIVGSALDILSAVDNSSVENVFQKIHNQGRDIFRQRIFNNTKFNSIPLEVSRTGRSMLIFLFTKFCAGYVPKCFYLPPVFSYFPHPPENKKPTRHYI
ncbi:MAG: hypothetical protein LWY06_20615 [Firmicutes bacterium]|nr:hypothetical protein [Bacillota bacterium]